MEIIFATGSDLKKFAAEILDQFGPLRKGIIVDSISIDPEILEFEKEIVINHLHDDG